MALLKDITLPSFAVAGYHRILKIEISTGNGAYDTPLVTITIGMYVSEAARRANAPTLNTKVIQIPLFRFNESPLRIGYEILKEFTGTEFSDSISDAPIVTTPINTSIAPQLMPPLPVPPPT